MVLRNRPCERIGKWETVRFERGQAVGARLAGASVIKTAILLGVSRATVSKVMSAYTNHGKTTSAARNSKRKSTLTERERRTLRRIISKNDRTTAAQVNCSRSEYSS
jgi:transposase